MARILAKTPPQSYRTLASAGAEPHLPHARTAPGESLSNPPAKYEGTERIEPPRLSTVPRVAGILITDSGTKPRRPLPPSNLQRVAPDSGANAFKRARQTFRTQNQRVKGEFGKNDPAAITLRQFLGGLSIDSIRSRPYERSVPPGRPLSLFQSRINAFLTWKRPERRRWVRSRPGPVCLCLCFEGCGGDETASRAPKRSSRCHGVNSARAPRRAIARQRTRAHAKARRERWRHVVERGAAIAANLLRRILHAEPVAARGTFRSQTLHRPSGQILHR